MMLQARSPGVGVMAHLILRARELRKLRSFIAARRSPDGRLRSSFNVGATTSGRWSFSKTVSATASTSATSRSAPGPCSFPAIPTG